MNRTNGASKAAAQTWPKKADAALAALMNEPSLTDAAKASGVSTRTITRWLARDDFGSALRKLREQAIRQAVNRLTKACGVAVSTLIYLTEHGENEGIRQRAAVAILEHTWKGQEQLDVTERLAALEQHQREMVVWAG